MHSQGWGVDVGTDFVGGLGACPQAGVSKGAAAPLALFWVQGGSPAGCGAEPREEKNGKFAFKLAHFTSRYGAAHTAR
eukprot:1698221-Prymnesium_polylepis.1